MSDFSTFITNRMTELDYQDARSEPFLRQATVRQLRELSTMPVDFLDGTFTFSTIAEQDNYGAGHTGFPVDIYSIVSLYSVPTGTNPLSMRHEIVGPKPIDEVRRRGAIERLLAVEPDVYAWHNDYLWLAPVPAGVVDIHGDYRRDGTRDSVTGAEITTASTTHTNGWFTKGENVLRCAVLLEWHLSIAKDATAAQLYSSQLEEYKGNLRKHRDARRVKGFQAPDTIFGSD